MKDNLLSETKKDKVLFLGPKAENQFLFEQLISEIIQDAGFLRKNFHPKDSFTIAESDKLDPSYLATVGTLKQELHNILAELKGSVPFYNPRYFGHMNGDLLLPGLAAYFATMIYNPNNVVGESSTATTRMEFKFIDKLLKMVGYNTMEDLENNDKQSWGHLCSGGTAANIEALWVARNMKYYPLAVKLAANEEKLTKKFLTDISVKFLGKTISELSVEQLFNLPPKAIAELKSTIYRTWEDHESKTEKYKTKKDIKKAIEIFDVVHLGVHGIHEKIKDVFKINLPLPKIYVAKTMHYSWQKTMDVIGLGQSQLVEVDIDSGYRMDINSLKSKLDTKSSTLAVIGILGSSKQGSIDPIDEIVAFRNDLENQKKYSFHIHIDAAYGGYMASMLRKESDELIEQTQFLKTNIPLLKGKGIETVFSLEEKGESHINEKWYAKVSAISKSDSFTIDPHKMGYVPYPAGCILFSETRFKDFISYTPSYLNNPEDSKEIATAFLGQWTLEGSRPGAPAVACYLNEKLMPFNKDNHGKLILNTILAANRFWEGIHRFNNSDKAKNSGFKIVPTYIPEFNIVSFVLACPEVIKKTKHLNLLTKALYHEFSIDGETVIPSKNYMIAKEDFAFVDMPGPEFLNNCGIDTTNIENTEIKTDIISCAFMNPMSIYQNEDFYDKFFEEMNTKARSVLSKIMLEIITEKKGGERLRVLWIENENEVNLMKQLLHYQGTVGKYLDIKFMFSNQLQDANQELCQGYDCIILDLNLKDTNHITLEFNAVQRALEIIQSVDAHIQKKILFYSAYFCDEVKRKKLLEWINKVMLTKEYQIIPKTKIPNEISDRSNPDIELLAQGIFKIMSSK